MLTFVRLWSSVKFEDKSMLFDNYQQYFSTMYLLQLEKSLYCRMLLKRLMYVLLCALTMLSCRKENRDTTPPIINLSSPTAGHIFYYQKSYHLVLYYYMKYLYGFQIRYSNWQPGSLHANWKRLSELRSPGTRAKLVVGSTSSRYQVSALKTFSLVLPPKM
jgi:hypothetical protein